MKIAKRVDSTLRDVLREVLGVSREQVDSMTESTPLFGALPEMDSMAVATLLTAFEDRLHIVIDDDDVDAESFDSFGSILAFLNKKIAA